MKYLKNSIVHIFDLVGLELKKKVEIRKEGTFPVELTKEHKELFKFVRENNLSMAPDERLFSTIMACHHVLLRNVDGDFVECGVWRGGNSLLAAGVFKNYGSNKKTYLYDTFAGMTEPTDFDHTTGGEAAAQKFQESQKSGYNEWCLATIDEVKRYFDKAKLLTPSVVFVQGDVLSSLQQEILLPQKISVLRLDTDWYESTKIELEVLYPRLSIGGILIIDDYGRWSGSRKAVDEYFEKLGNRPFLNYVDGSSRVGVKIA